MESGAARRPTVRIRRAERQLQRDYEGLRGATLRAVRTKLRTRGVHVDAADLDAAYNQAWHALYLKLREGEEIESPEAFLTQVAFFRAVDDYRQLHVDRRHEAGEIDDGMAVVSDDLDLDARLDDTRALHAFVQGMKERLTATECAAAALCYLHGYTRPQAAEILGIRPKRMQKLMDGVSKKVGVFTDEIRSDEWCASRGSLVKAYAMGMLDEHGDRYQLAAAHLKDCPACRRYVRSLRGIGAVVPPILLPWAALGVAGGAGAGAGASAAGGAHAAGGASRGVRVGLGAAAAAVVVAIAAVGAVAMTAGDDSKDPPKAKTTVAAAVAPAGGAVAGAAPAAASASHANAKAKKKVKKKAKPKPKRHAAVVVAAPAASAPTPVPAPVVSAPAPAPEPKPAPKPEKPTTDGAQEFGVEP